MVAMSDAAQAKPSRKGVQRIEAQDMDAVAAHLIEELVRGADRTEAVVNNVDLNTLKLLVDERIGELLTDRIVGKNEGLEVDALPGLHDQAEHLSVRGGSVFQ